MVKFILWVDTNIGILGLILVIFPGSFVSMIFFV